MARQGSHRVAAGTYHALRALRRGARDVWFRVLTMFFAGPTSGSPRLDQARRLLLAHVNHRLGNNLLVTPAVAALRERFPSAEIDFLGAPVAPPLLSCLGMFVGARALEGKGLPIETFARITHLAIASNTRTVGLFCSWDPRRWGPRPPHGDAVVDSTGEKADAVTDAVVRLYRDPGTEALAS